MQFAIGLHSSTIQPIKEPPLVPTQEVEALYFLIIYFVTKK